MNPPDDANAKPESSSEAKESRDFIRDLIREDLAAGKNEGRVHTRFPPEPNGYLHIGHAKSVCLNFGVAREFGGLCNLRFDDTNPAKEDPEYVASIQNDVRWLGFDWEERLYYASSYFEKMYEYALQLVKKGKAYVDSQSEEEIRRNRGTVKSPGTPSPYRERSVEENLDLFTRMKNGEFEDGTHVLRAKIDMGASNMKMRDPLIYRIRHASHHQTRDKWCIYPFYDFAHCLEDSIEGITHSLCTLEFEINRELYDWFLDELEVECHPQQIEFARLNLNYTVMSKRKLLQLVQEKVVKGWDDPRMPTLAGLRRRGYTPAAIRTFAERIGVAKRDSVVDIALLEHTLREDLNANAPRVMAVLDPLKVVIENYPEDKVEWMEAINNPEDESAGSREIPFAREIYIERGDFMEDPPRKFFRLAPGREVRLKHAYLVTCTDVVKNEAGELVELRCEYDPKSRGGEAPDGRRVKGTLHWVSAAQSLPATVQLYDKLFTVENPGEAGDLHSVLNPDSLEVLENCRVEPSLAEGAAGRGYQFLRHGYFCLDLDSKPDALVFNRTVGLRDTWAKIQKKN
ncbi:MAG TPA: glutamine--tRNA ligase/YqeY domain fusion protein [Candidatus Krumholzibacteria bacterium]|nr:glutamine--tRNA ligase/YqeY domain fusion protein [Candidatus Krumholzibacteria bacterium]